jgi:hypothetical protein
MITFAAGGVAYGKYPLNFLSDFPCLYNESPEFPSASLFHSYPDHHQ